MGSKMSNMRLWAVIICGWYHDHGDDPIRDNHSCMNTITKGNSWHYQWSTPVVSGDKLSNNNGVMTENQSQTWTEDPIIKSSHCPRQWKESSSSSNPQSDITSEEHLKILLRILSTFKITSLFSLREFALYEFVETNTFSVRTTEGRRTFQRSHTVLQRAGFNPHLPRAFILSDYRRFRIWSAQVHHYRCITLRRAVRRATLDRRGRVGSSYI